MIRMFSLSIKVNPSRKSTLTGLGGPGDPILVNRLNLEDVSAGGVITKDHSWNLGRSELDWCLSSKYHW